MKRRKVVSMKKDYQGFGKFLNEQTGKKIEFNFYEDKQIGFTIEWQKKLKITEMDDDIKTDEEQLDLAINHIVQDINTGLQRFQEENNYK